MEAWRGGCQSLVEAELVLVLLVSCIVIAAGNPSKHEHESTSVHRLSNFPTRSLAPVLLVIY